MDARSRMREVSFEAVVIRADGSREDLGTISYWHRNPLKRFVYKLRSIRGNLRR